MASMTLYTSVWISPVSLDFNADNQVARIVPAELRGLARQVRGSCSGSHDGVRGCRGDHHDKYTTDWRASGTLEDPSQREFWKPIFDYAGKESPGATERS
jgi:hypothetical protein